MSNSRTVIVQENEQGEAYIQLPDRLLTGDQPWLPGDRVEWAIMNNGHAILTNIDWQIRNSPDYGDLA